MKLSVYTISNYKNVIRGHMCIYTNRCLQNFLRKNIIFLTIFIYTKVNNSKR